MRGLTGVNLRLRHHPRATLQRTERIAAHPGHDGVLASVARRFGELLQYRVVGVVVGGAEERLESFVAIRCLHDHSLDFRVFHADLRKHIAHRRSTRGGLGDVALR
jgi:hypothetical protein